MALVKVWNTYSLHKKEGENALTIHSVKGKGRYFGAEIEEDMRADRSSSRLLRRSWKREKK